MEVTKPVGAAQHTEPHLLIGTPSKLLDPVNGLCGHTFDASSFICVILDEMDQLLARNLSDMLTSLMTFLPSNSSAGSHSSETSQPSPPLLSTKHDTDTSSSPPTSTSAPEDWSLSQLRQSPNNSASSLCNSDGRTLGRQTCIFSCTVPQDVLAYARSLNLRVKVIVRREENNNSTSCNTPSVITPMASNFDLGDP
jgi:translation initiation factor 4A